MDRVGALAHGVFEADNLLFANSFLLARAPLFRAADVVHLHNLHGGYFNLATLPRITAKKPTVWTLHDMWPLTGHCAYSYACERWRTCCHHCPLLREPGRRVVEPPPTRRDRTCPAWRRKRRIYRRSEVNVVAPSEWLLDKARRGLMAGAGSLRRIPYGIDLEDFRPIDRQTARRALGLDGQTFVAFFSAESARNPRKGFQLLVEALRAVSGKTRICLLTTGKPTEDAASAPGLLVRQLGQIESSAFQRLALSAADLTALPSLADNLPLVAIESLACGTPVIGCKVGGVPESVEHMKTGYLAAPESQSIARGLLTLVERPGLLRRMRRLCRERACALFDKKLQAERYLALYREAIRNDKSSPACGARSESGEGTRP
jgi:glycosyltransferase involved in cell wall biosynthesis